MRTATLVFLGLWFDFDVGRRVTSVMHGRGRGTAQIHLRDMTGFVETRRKLLSATPPPQIERFMCAP